jgi:choline dehydrogenase
MMAAFKSTLSLLVLSSLLGFVAATLSQSEYEYIVVGSGPGGGPFAANLARAGRRVLLIEAGDDQTANVNVSQWLNFNAAGNDPATRWDFFVSHSDDEARESRYLRTTWRTKEGGFYVGLDPPAGATRLGIYYPRAGTLGGCAMHNGCLTMNPDDADWDYIAEITGDSSWTAKNMRKYLISAEHANYNSSYKHGHSGWLQTTMLDSAYQTNNDTKDVMRLVAESYGYNESDLAWLNTRDMNGAQPDRDQLTGIFGGVSHIWPDGRRSSPGYYVKDTLAANYTGLTLWLNTLVTKVLIDSNKTAYGVEYLKGKSMYSADPRYNASDPGTSGTVTASRGIVISGGTFNSPQILMLSGIGPAEQLKKLGIPVVIDAPGVGQQVADNYEGGLLTMGARAFEGTFGFFPTFFKSSVAQRIRDIYMWCGYFSFEGFWPG